MRDFPFVLWSPLWIESMKFRVFAILTAVLLSTDLSWSSEPQNRAASEATPAERTPNFILVFVDDMGYGDLGCFGSKVHATPHLDQMAREGIRMTDFYSSCSVCTPC